MPTMRTTREIDAVPSARGALRRAARKAFKWLMAVALAGAVVAPVQAQVVIAVGKSPKSLPIHIAHVEGYFRDEGVDLQIEDCTYGRVCLERLASGKVHMATVAESPIALAGLAGAQPLIVATICTSRRDAKIITRQRGNVRSAGDLDGKRIGTFIGTTAHYFLHLTMLMTGGDPSDVRLVALKSEDDIGARLASGDLDAVAVFEPYGYEIARALGDDAKVITNSAFSYAWNLVSTRKTAETHVPQFERILRAIERGVQFIQRHPEQAKAMARRWLNLDEAALDWVWPGLSFQLTLDRTLLMSLQGHARWALRFGYATGQMADFRRFFYPEPLLRVRPDARRNLP